MSGNFKTKRENRLNSIVWDKLQLEVGEIPKVIYHVWDEIKNQNKVNSDKGKTVNKTIDKCDKDEIKIGQDRE